jgi:hypothetical protein
MPSKPFRPRNVISPRRTGLESNTREVLQSIDGRHRHFRWTNFWGTTLPWINNNSVIVPWVN